MTTRSSLLDHSARARHSDLQSVRVDGRSVILSEEEFALLTLLVRQAGHVLRHQEIYAALWGPHVPDDTHRLDGLWSRQRLTLLISHLRRKVEVDGQHQGLIQTVHGVGYRVEGPVALGPERGGQSHRRRVAQTGVGSRVPPH